jgi:hypothetical protein
MEATTRRLSKGMALAATAIVACSLTSTPAADASPAASSDIPTMTFLSPEEFASLYKSTTGELPPANLPTTPVHGLVRTESGKVIDTDSVMLDPTPGSSIYTIMWTDKDLSNRKVPTRLGNGDFGYNHYVRPHNLYTAKPFRAIGAAHRGVVEQGAHVEYQAIVTQYQPPRPPRATMKIRIVTQLATRTDDRRYTSPDGKYIGTITAYCEGVNRCPDWVNAI